MNEFRFSIPQDILVGRGTAENGRQQVLRFIRLAIAVLAKKGDSVSSCIP